MVEKVKEIVGKGIEVGRRKLMTNRGTLLALVILFPLGVYLVWRKSSWSKANKIISTVVGAVIVMVFMHNSYLVTNQKKLLEDIHLAEVDLVLIQSKATKLNQELVQEISQHEALVAETTTYKEKMKPYEALSAADAQKKIADLKAEEAKKKEEELYKQKKLEQEKRDKEAKQKAEEEKAAAKKREEEAEQKRLKDEEEARGYETGISYDELARTPDDFLFKKIKFSGKVVQVMDGEDTIQIRLAVDGNYDTILYGEYESSIVSSRVLEDDYITISGLSSGLTTYKSTMGGSITIPSALIKIID